MENKKHHPTTIKKAEAYAENNKDVKGAYLDGYAEARKDSHLKWFDISDIISIAFSLYPDLREIDYDSQSICKKIADKANKEIFGRHYI